MARLAALTALVCLGAAGAGATEVALSTTLGGTLGGLSFSDGDVAHYDDQTGVGTLLLDETAAFSASENVDAFHVLANGHYAISTRGLADIGGLSISNGDVVEYDPVGDVATLLFSESVLSSGGNVDAFSVLSNGHFLLSTVGGDSIGGASFGPGDLVAYDPVGGTASIFLSAGAFTSSSPDIDAVHAQSDTVLILSTTGTASIGGVTFADGDLVRYDTVSDTAVIVFSQSEFTSGLEDIDAVYVEPPGFPVPEPGTGALLAFGLAALAGRRARHA